MLKERYTHILAIIDVIVNTLCRISHSVSVT